MHRNDGHKVVQSSKKIEVVQCSRWEEITSSVIWHAEMAAWCQNPTAIVSPRNLDDWSNHHGSNPSIIPIISNNSQRLMKDPGNHVGPQQVGICASKHITSPEELKRAKDLLRRTRPVGASSPINFHLLEIISSTQYLIPILEQTQSRLVLHICTDSIPSDPEGHELPELKAGLRTILLQLIDMPIQVVLRLSTDDERVVDFYKEMAYEALFVKRLQVIDDFVSECAQVKRWNPWMNYGYPLHLCREGGVYVPAVEQLSHRKLLVPEVIEVLALVLGIVVDSKTYIPSIDYDGLRKQIKTLNEKTGKCWSPISSSYVPWINMKQLDKLHNVDGCTIS